MPPRTRTWVVAFPSKFDDFTSNHGDRIDIEQAKGSRG